MNATKAKLSKLAKKMVDEYKVVTSGSDRYLTDAVRRGLLADAMATIMLAQYQVEQQSGQDAIIEAFLEARNYLEL